MAPKYKTPKLIIPPVGGWPTMPITSGPPQIPQDKLYNPNDDHVNDNSYGDVMSNPPSRINVNSRPSSSASKPATRSSYLSNSQPVKFNENGLPIFSMPKRADPNAGNTRQGSSTTETTMSHTANALVSRNPTDEIDTKAPTSHIFIQNNNCNALNSAASDWEQNVREWMKANPSWSPPYQDGYPRPPWLPDIYQSGLNGTSNNTAAAQASSKNTGKLTKVMIRHGQTNLVVLIPADKHHNAFDIVSAQCNQEGLTDDQKKKVWERIKQKLGSSI